MTASSPMDLMLNLLERKQSVVDVLDNRQLPALARKRIRPLDRVYFLNNWNRPLLWDLIQRGQWKSRTSRPRAKARDFCLG